MLGTIFHQGSGPSSRKSDSGHCLFPPSSIQALLYPRAKPHQTHRTHSTSNGMLCFQYQAMSLDVVLFVATQNGGLFFHISPNFITPRPEFAVPRDFIRSHLVQSDTGRRFVLPHFSCHVVPSFSTHWQNGFRVYRKQDHQLCEALLTRRT